MQTRAAVEAPEDIAGIGLPVLFDYNPGDPLAVSLTFGGEGEDGVVWVIGRDLLHDGLSEAAGVGDVTAWTGSADRERYYLRLRTGASFTLFTFETRMIETYLWQTYASIPAGAELPTAALDAELSAIFGEVA